MDAVRLLAAFLTTSYHNKHINSTLCGYYHAGLGPGTLANLADFNSPVPASAYSCQQIYGGFG